MAKSKQKPESKRPAEEYDFAGCLTRMDRMGPYHKPDVIAAIHKTLGDFGQMAQLLGRKRQAVRDYVLGNLDVKDVLDEVNETVLDAVETTCRSMALAGDGPSVRFLLKTLGKDRGYVTRVENTGKGGEPLEAKLTFDWSKLSKDQLRAVRSAIVDES